ncbi:Na(+)/serine-threonine symporter [Anaerobiospirillum thomasii]|uniref:Serine/threonine transporter SstT n=1 Tax=Anaerobiospirillum thomasii TaxID=179995 RepID=A0A2X0X1I7_9GAMM|nr:serine/threonine transporter SstT [Anaerobiospirillum thomasii]SPT69816.1 Na(+)/serine-threonine symporter [Anaerobiospirillum thomasii]SPT71581.1 Na(+)/serine-threonine symporter [Anaerobiospirillum thomasii]
MSESRNPQALLASTLNKVPFIMQILAGLIIGVIIGAIYPNDHTVLPTMGSLFVKALKSVAPILVFVLVAAAIARHEKGTQSNMRPIVVVYFISMVLASTLALSMSYIFPSTFSELASAADDLSPPQGIAEVLTNFVNQAIDNPVTALMNGNYIAILFWAIALGLMFRTAHDNTKKVLEDLTQSVAGVVRIIIRFAPLGVMGLVYSSVTQEGGFANLLNYVHVLLVLIGSMLLIGFVLNAGIVYYMTRENPYPLIFTCVARSGVTAFFTRSSAANLPVNLALCEKLNLPRETYTISIPLGATINMSGAAVTIVIMTMAAVHTLGIEVDFFSALLMSISAVLCACGASGVAGGSLMLIPLACSIFGIGNDVAMQIVGIGFIIGVLQDSTETALNSFTDVLFTAAVCKRAQRLQKKAEQKAAAQ